MSFYFVVSLVINGVLESNELVLPGEDHKVSSQVTFKKIHKETSSDIIHIYSSLQFISSVRLVLTNIKMMRQFSRLAGQSALAYKRGLNNQMFPRHSLPKQRRTEHDRGSQKETSYKDRRIWQEPFSQDQKMKHFADIVSSQEPTGLTLLRKYLANA